MTRVSLDTSILPRCVEVSILPLVQPTVHDHFYTANANEKNTAAQTGGYVDEGIAGYVLPV